MRTSTVAASEGAAMGRRLAVFAAAYGAVVLWGATPMATKVAVAGLDQIAASMAAITIKFRITFYLSLL